MMHGSMDTNCLGFNNNSVINYFNKIKEDVSKMECACGSASV